MDDQLIKECTAKAQTWLGAGFDAETKAEVKAMLDADDKSALIDAFYQNLEFGTGGLRGIMGAGTNRMNKYVVGMATQGFANYINKAFPNIQPAVVVGHDCRNNGRMFAETVANIFSANGIKVYLFESLRPTPEISFAIRQLKAQAGVNVTDLSYLPFLVEVVDKISSQVFVDAYHGSGISISNVSHLLSKIN